MPGHLAGADTGCLCNRISSRTGQEHRLDCPELTDEVYELIACWLAPVLKTGVPARVPRVRIPVSPLYQLHSDSRNPCLTSYVDKGCGCRCFRARPVYSWVVVHSRPHRFPMPFRKMGVLLSVNFAEALLCSDFPAKLELAPEFSMVRPITDCVPGRPCLKLSSTHEQPLR
jgi:hypothetical protein